MKYNLALNIDYQNESDEALWKDLRNNNKDAFAIIYYRFFNLLLKKGLQISGERELVEDCIHDLFLEIWKNKLKLSIPLSVKAYLISCIQRKIIRQLKKSRSQQIKMDMLPSEHVASKEDQLIMEQHLLNQQFVVIQAVNSLTMRQQEAIRLKFYANHSYEEISGLMKISTDSIYNLVSKAIDNLQIELTKETELMLY